MMNAKERAIELIGNQRKHVDFFMPESDSMSKYLLSVQCAIVVVDEIMKEYSQDSSSMFRNDVIEHYTEVINELNNML